MTDDSEQERWTDGPKQWSDEELADALDGKWYSHSIRYTVGRSRVRREAARRLRGGEGEWGMDPENISVRVGGDASPETLRDAGRALLQKADALSPTDGEGAEIHKCPNGGGHPQTRGEVFAEALGVDYTSRHRRDAAPDTEGREGPTSADISFGEAKTVHGGACSCPLCVPDKPMSRARPEEAGGEGGLDELPGASDAEMQEMVNRARREMMDLADEHEGDPLGAKAGRALRAMDWLRLRGAPEGAGEEEPWNVLIDAQPPGTWTDSQLARFVDMVGPIFREAARRLRTGREGRDGG